MSGVFRKYLPKGLFARTFLIVIVPVLILQLAISAVFFQRHWSKMTERLADAVVGEITAVIDELNDYNDDAERVQHAFSLAERHFGLRFMFDAQSHTLPARKGDESIGIARDFRKSLDDEIVDPIAVTVYRGKKQIIADIAMDKGILTIMIPEGRLYSASSYIFILWMLGLSLVLFTIALMFMRNQIRPIYRLGLIADRMGRGIPVARFKPTGAREVRQAAEAFIRMQDRIQGFINQRTTMLAGVSHDLRTPLTRMKLQLEMLDETPDSIAMKQDIADMEAMIEEYLAFSKGDDGEEIQRIDVENFVSQLKDDAKRLDLKVLSEGQIDKEVSVWGKPNALRRAFDNFLSNAARYGDTVSIAVVIAEDNFEVVISDNGMGIEDKFLKDVIKPFFRIDGSRNHKTGGVGLGLAIANDIISAHAGEIILGRSSTLGGLEVRVVLPI